MTNESQLEEQTKTIRAVYRLSKNMADYDAIRKSERWLDNQILDHIEKQQSPNLQHSTPDGEVWYNIVMTRYHELMSAYNDMVSTTRSYNLFMGVEDINVEEQVAKQFIKNGCSVLCQTTLKI